MKVLLVDDEQIIRRGIRTFIPWEELGCSLAGEASDGFEALSLMEEIGADIVITDIRMPGMDGLKLAGELERSYPKCRVIILTGYGDFEYARQAIKYNVADYLLKPVGEEELTEVLKKTVRILEQQAEELRNTCQMREMISENLDEIRKRILEDLAQREPETGAICHRAEQAGLVPPGKTAYQVLMIFPESGKNDPAGLPDIPASFPVIPVCQEGRLGFLVILFRKDASPGRGDSPADQFFREIRKRDILTAAGGVEPGLEGLAASYRQALEAFSCRRYSVRPGVIHYKSHKEIRERFLRTLPPPVSPAEAENLMTRQFDSLHTETNQLAAQLLHGCLLADQSREDYIRFCRRLHIVIRKEAERKGIRIPASEGDPFRAVIAQDSWKLILEGAETVFHRLAEQCISHMEQTYSPLTVQAIRYVESHFKEDISLSRISEITRASESHISRVFKKDTGINFVPWVNRYRVEYSRELLVSPELKLYDVADLAGFSDYKYYTRQFKRYIGISPMEYRRNLFSD